MADFSSLKQTIQTYVKQNGNEEITGNILQDVLLAMVSTMGDSAINGLASALQDEAAARQNQDGILQGNISTLGGRIDTLQTAINGINTKLAEGYIYAGIATSSTNPGAPSGKVFYIAVSSGTYTNFSNLIVAQGINILKYNGSAWLKDVVYAIDPRPMKASQNLVTSGGVFDNIGAIDVSELNATENPHTLAQYANLSAALAAIPTDYQKGGMSIKFVQSSDNKYVQYRLMNQNWSTTVSDWQGVDDEPTAGSSNLTKSGGIAAQIGFNAFDVDDLIETSGIGISANNGTFDNYQWGTVYRWIPVSEGTIINYKLGAKSTHLVMAFYTSKDASTYIANSGIAGAGGDNYVTGYTIVPTGAKYMAISIITGTANNFCFVGVPSLVHQYINENNTFIGAGSMKRVVENSAKGVKMNVAVGVDSLGKITSTGTEDDGCYNVAVGHSALKENTTGNHNTGVGFNAAKETTTGSFNTAIGEDAMFNATTGEKNTCIGTYSGRNITQGERNICIGFNGGGSIKAGGSNILVGSYAGQPWNSDHTHDVEDDSNLIMIGGFTSKDVTTTLQNAIAIGQGAKIDKSYQCVLGSSEIIEFILGNKKLVFNQDGTVTWVSR